MTAGADWSALFSDLDQYREKTELAAQSVMQAAWEADYAEARRRMDTLRDAYLEFRSELDNTQETK